MLEKEVLELKEEKNAIVLAHNYQLPEVQDVADFVGDSLELARKAVNVDAEIIVFAGVDFMAETAKILNPDKKVLLPNKRARCPMAHMLRIEDIIKARKEYPDAPVVLYVNTTAECKALADVVVTSANAAEVVDKLDSDTVIFGPDKNLAYYVSKKTGKQIIPVPENGYCYTHIIFTESDVEEARKQHPDAKLMVHPECDPEIQEKADLIVSTGGMVRNACKHNIWVVFTEREMCYRLKKLYPDKEFYHANRLAVCKAMKSINLKSIHESLKYEKHEVVLPEEIALKAKRAIERMLEMSG